MPLNGFYHNKRGKHATFDPVKAHYTESMIRIFIVDRHPLVRQALENRLTVTDDLEIVGSTGRYQFAVQRVGILLPDVILLETKAPTGIETLKALRAASPKSAVIVLTSYPDSREEDITLQNGAVSYVLKNLNTKALIQEIHHAASHRHRPTSKPFVYS
jgi:DNA-binding NarL/FixJ family response regulator